MNYYDVVFARDSVRAYLDLPVPEDAVMRVLESARVAPSACNKQPWHFYVLRDAAVRQRAFPHPNQAWIAAAPVIIVGCCLPGEAWVRGADGKNFAEFDLAIAMEHVMLSATEEGLGTCWIGAFDPAAMREAIDLPAEHVPVAATPLGYFTAKADGYHRKPLDKIVTWR